MLPAIVIYHRQLTCRLKLSCKARRCGVSDQVDGVAVRSMTDPKPRKSAQLTVQRLPSSKLARSALHLRVEI